MPTYRSITTSLVSQYDIQNIPEFTPPAALNDPFSTPPPGIDTDRALISVYIPIYPASQFWLSYEISPPNPPRLLYYFKLYVSGRHIVSWGCGADDDFRGKTMFGLFDQTQINGNVRQSHLERRVFCFSSDDESVQNEVPNSLSGLMEIKVFRSKGRKRIEPETQDYQSSLGMQHSDKKSIKRRADDDGIKLVNGGYLTSQEPRRYYKYALLDPLDKPFATFHYYYRSWDQLVTLGVVSPPPSTVTSSIRSLTPQQRPASPESGELELASLASLSHSLESTIAEPPKTAGTQPVMTDRNESNDSNNSTGMLINLQSPDSSSRSQNSTNSTNGSPLVIPRLNPLRMHRPPTPPPRSSPIKNLAQLPSTIPPKISTLDLSLNSLNALNTLTRKASFTSLVRTHLPDSNTSTFQLKPPNLTPPMVSTRPSRSASIGALMEVVNNAKKRRSSRESEVGSEGSSSGGASLGNGEKKDREIEWELMGSERKKEREERKREREERKRERKRRDEKRKLHLWEEI